MNKLEQEFSEIGITRLESADEVGRGCGAGPMCMASVMLPPNHHIDPKYLRDSKKMSRRARETASKLIHERVIDLNIVEISEKYIDQHGISEATREGIRRLIKKFKVKPQMIIMDGRDLKFETFDIPYMCVEKSEDLCYSSGAASIVAKVYRDELMKNIYHPNFPEYEFDKNKGYLTKLHVAKIEQYGVCPIHRMSYNLKGELLGARRKNPKYWR